MYCHGLEDKVFKVLKIFDNLFGEASMKGRFHCFYIYIMINIGFIYTDINYTIGVKVYF